MELVKMLFRTASVMKGKVMKRKVVKGPVRSLVVHMQGRAAQLVSTLTRCFAVWFAL